VLFFSQEFECALNWIKTISGFSSHKNFYHSFDLRFNKTVKEMMQKFSRLFRQEESVFYLSVSAVFGKYKLKW